MHLAMTPGASFYDLLPKLFNSNMAGGFTYAESAIAYNAAIATIVELLRR